MSETSMRTINSMTLIGGKSACLENNLCGCRFIHHKSHMGGLQLTTCDTVLVPLSGHVQFVLSCIWRNEIPF